MCACPASLHRLVHICVYIYSIRTIYVYIYLYLYIYIYANMQPLTDSRPDGSTCYISRCHLEPPHLPGDGKAQVESPRYGHPLGLEDSVLPEVPPTERLSWPFPVQGADLLPVHPRADPEGRVAGTSTCGGCREGGAARVRHFGVCARPAPLHPWMTYVYSCVYSCVYISVYIYYLYIYV